jgi:hypothetical protein
MLRFSARTGPPASAPYADTATMEPPGSPTVPGVQALGAKALVDDLGAKVAGQNSPQHKNATSSCPLCHRVNRRAPAIATRSCLEFESFCENLPLNLKWVTRREERTLNNKYFRGSASFLAGNSLILRIFTESSFAVFHIYGMSGIIAL